MAETSKFRNHILNLIVAFAGKSMYNLDVIDIGSGDDPLTNTVDKFDLPTPYTQKCKVEELTFKGDCRLVDQIVAPNVYDVVFSSHLLEDFLRHETNFVLETWIRIIKKQGLLVLLLPDQQRYEAFCKKVDELPNEHHQIPEFSSAYVHECLAKIPEMKTLYIEEFTANSEYNFLIIAKKIA